MADSSLFSFRQGNQLVFILVYVDDLLVVSSTAELADQFITALSSKFHVKDLGPLHYFLGIEVQRSKEGFSLSQTRYIRDLCSKCNMHNSKAITTLMSTTPMVPNSTPFSDSSLYRSVVGSLQYLSFTRPDISFAVNRVCQYMQNPHDHHWQAVKLIIRYLNVTAEL